MTVLMQWVFTFATSLALASMGIWLGAQAAVVAVLAVVGMAGAYGLCLVGWIRPMRAMQAQLQARDKDEAASNETYARVFHVLKPAAAEHAATL